MPRYDFVLLDADNTLFDFDAAERAALRRAMEERGYPFNAETEGAYLTINRALWSVFDRGEIAQEVLVVERFRRLNARLDGDADPVRFNHDYLTYLGQSSQLLPGAEALCRDLARQCTLALCTNGVARVQHARLEASPLTPYLSGVFISEELGCQKPQAEFFTQVFQSMHIADPSRCVMVGDGLASDIQGGINAGIDTIWYAPKGQPPRPDVTPTFTARSYDHIRQLILV